MSVPHYSTDKPYRTVSDYFGEIFPDRVQKIGIDAGLGCPGRCTYCSNASFTPGYACGSVSEQLEKGIRFFESKGTCWGYLAYFQSHTNTFGDTGKLVGLYEEALRFHGVKGLVIATRPDCLSPELLDYFQNRFVGDNKPYLLVELGVESTNGTTLKRIRRGHNWECSRTAIEELTGRGIPVGVHLIIGLPGETADDYLLHAERIGHLGLSTLKLHQLQIIKGTPLAAEYLAHPFPLLDAQEYADIICRMLPLLDPRIALDRFVSESPAGMLLAPRWGLKPDQFRQLLDSRLQ